MKRDATDMLERRLREEAKMLREKDGFSPILHERIMVSLRQNGLAGAPVDPELAWTPWRIAGWAAVAAAIAIAAVIMLKSGSTDERPKPQDVVDVTTPKAPIAQGPRVDPATSALNERKYAYLDRDANHLLTFVAGQFPSFPSVSGNDGPHK